MGIGLVTLFILWTLVGVHMIFSIWPFLFGYVMRMPVLLRDMVCAFLHVGVQHLFVNVMAVIDLGHVERVVGSRVYASQILYFVGVNALLWGLVRMFWTVSFSIGFSGVLFGMRALYPVNRVLYWYCDPRYSVFVLLFVVQLLSPGASFVGHLVGIIAAYLKTIERIPFGF